MLALADKGPAQAVAEDRALARDVNIWAGHIVHPGVAAAVGESAVPLDAVRPS